MLTSTELTTFEVYQDLLEQVASDAFDADACNEAGCVIVTKETLDKMSKAPQRCNARPRASLNIERQSRQLRPTLYLKPHSREQ